MSGSSNILSAIQAAGQLFAGYGSLTLGPIRFHGLAKPESMPIGGKQSVITHKLPGGGRVIDAMGPDNSDIGWSGYLDGSDAGLTARALDKLRQSGQTVTLAWDVFSYQVLVTAFSCETRHVPMPYKLTCTVISDNSQTLGRVVASLAMQVTADLTDGCAMTAYSSAVQGILGSSLSAALAASTAVDATTLGSASYTSAVSTVGSAAGSINNAIEATNFSLLPAAIWLNLLSTAAPVGVDPAAMLSQITAASAACGDLAQLAYAGAFFNRAAANLDRASA